MGLGPFGWLRMCWRDKPIVLWAAAIVLIILLITLFIFKFPDPSSTSRQQPVVPLPTATAAMERTPIEVQATSKMENSVTVVGLWQRHEIPISNSSWSGNPFDIELVGHFTQVGTGRTVRQLGFYAGEDTWKIFFMPDQLGLWEFSTSSPDPELSGASGRLKAVPSDHPGRLLPDGNRWRLESTGEYLAPILLPTRRWFKRTETDDGVGRFIDWSHQEAGAHVIGTTLVYFGHAQDESVYIHGREGVEFNLPMWDRLNQHYDRLRDQGMGHYIMFYSDDSESPNRHGITARSSAELRLFRYAVARFSAYPIVLWDSAIDVGESRNHAWIDWFARWFQTNDPWGHPVSSRTGGGSRGKVPEEASYYSDGARTLPGHERVVRNWARRPIPTVYTDRWREDYGRGGFDRDRIRQAAWEVGLVGGTGVYIGGSENGGYLNGGFAADLQAAPDLSFRTWYFENKIEYFGELLPRPDLVVSGQDAVLAAVPGLEYVVYDHTGGEIELDITAATGPLIAEWFNPRSGELVPIENVAGGSTRRFTPPGPGDWVFHLLDTGGR